MSRGARPGEGPPTTCRGRHPTSGPTPYRVRGDRTNGRPCAERVAGRGGARGHVDGLVPGRVDLPAQSTAAAHTERCARRTCRCLTGRCRRRGSRGRTAGSTSLTWRCRSRCATGHRSLPRRWRGGCLRRAPTPPSRFRGVGDVGSGATTTSLVEALRALRHGPTGLNLASDLVTDATPPATVRVLNACGTGTCRPWTSDPR